MRNIIIYGLIGYGIAMGIHSCSDKIIESLQTNKRTSPPLFLVYPTPIQLPGYIKYEFSTWDWSDVQICFQSLSESRLRSQDILSKITTRKSRWAILGQKGELEPG
jgi:hypothetical protein